jgi:hypothetical protein
MIRKSGIQLNHTRSMSLSDHGKTPAVFSIPQRKYSNTEDISGISIVLLQRQWHCSNNNTESAKVIFACNSLISKNITNKRYKPQWNTYFVLYATCCVWQSIDFKLHFVKNVKNSCWFCCADIMMRVILPSCVQNRRVVSEIILSDSHPIMRSLIHFVKQRAVSDTEVDYCDSTRSRAFGVTHTSAKYVEVRRVWH